MKSAILIFFLLIGSVAGNTQNINLLNGKYVDQNGTVFSGTYNQKYENGMIKAEFTVSTGELEG